MKELLHDLVRLREKMIGAELSCAPLVEEAHPTQRASARNLLHFVTLRKHDSSRLNRALTARGLSPMKGINGTVLAEIDRAISLLQRLTGADAKAGRGRGARSAAVARKKAVRPEIMVTLSGESSSDLRLMKELLRSGMSVLRINCARDSAGVWQELIDTLKSAEKDTGKPCRVFMDLAGPKLRTGLLAERPGVLRWSPQRDRMGRVTAPARIRLIPHGRKPDTVKRGEVSLPVPAGWLSKRTVGEILRFVDARGAKRSISVTGREGEALRGEGSMTAYVTNGIQLTSDRDKSSIEIRGIPAAEEEIRLHVGDRLWLTKSPIPGREKELDEMGRTVLPASISVTLPEVLSGVKSGEKVWIDDGKIGGVVSAVKKGGVELVVTHASPRGSRLKADRGINLPDSRVGVISLTSKDREDLRFVVRHADLVGFSFIRRASDVHDLQQQLATLHGEHLEIVLKIENLFAFERLPEILIAGMRSKNVAVLIARGDLAVECGFKEIPYIQQEIFEACAAAGMPVFIATQVLETMSQKGTPSRPEIVDALVAARADCVMLNKGPFVVEAVKLLRNLLRHYHSYHSN